MNPFAAFLLAATLVSSSFADTAKKDSAAAKDSPKSSYSDKDAKGDTVKDAPHSNTNAPASKGSSKKDPKKDAKAPLTK